MSTVMEIILRATDEASAVLDKVGGAGEDAAGKIDVSWNAAAVALAAAGAGVEALARTQEDETFAVDKMSIRTGVNADTIRSWAMDIAGANTNISEMTDLMDLGNRRGLEGEAPLQAYAQFWDTIAKASGESSTELATAGVALAAVGIEAGHEGDAMGALGYIVNDTTGSVSDFLGFVGRTGPSLRAMGMDVNDTAAVMGILQNEFGETGRKAVSEFNKAVNSSDGDMTTLLSTLGISADMLDKYRGKVAASADILDVQAKAFDDTRTPLQHLQILLGNVTSQFGGAIEGASQLAPILMSLGPIMWGLEAAKKAWNAVTGITAGTAAVAGEAGAIAAGGPAVAGAVAAQGPEAAAAGMTMGRLAGAAVTGGIVAGVAVGGVLVLDAVTQALNLDGSHQKWDAAQDKFNLTVLEANLRSSEPGVRESTIKAFQGMPDAAEKARLLTALQAAGIAPDIIAALQAGVPGVKTAANGLTVVVTESAAQVALDTKLLAAGIPQSIVDQLDAGTATLEMAADGSFKAIPIALTNADLAAEALAAGAPQSIADAIAAGKGTLSIAADGTFSVIPAAAAKAGTDTVSSVGTTMAGAAQAIKDGRSAIVTAMTSVISDAYDPLINAQEQLVAADQIAADKQALTAKGLTQAQKDEAKLQLLQDQQRYADLVANATQYGTDAQRVAALNGQLVTDGMVKGLKAGDPAALAAFAAILAEIKADGGSVDNSPAGQAAMASYMSGLATYWNIQGAKILSEMTLTGSPVTTGSGGVPVSGGPIGGTVKVPHGAGAGAVASYATGVWDLVSDALVLAHQGEMIVPAAPAAAMRAAVAAGGSSGGFGGGGGGFSGPLVYINNYSGGEAEDERLGRILQRRLVGR